MIVWSLARDYAVHRALPGSRRVADRFIDAEQSGDERLARTLIEPGPWRQVAVRGANLLYHTGRAVAGVQGTSTTMEPARPLFLAEATDYYRYASGTGAFSVRTSLDWHGRWHVVWCAQEQKPGVLNLVPVGRN